MHLKVYLKIQKQLKCFFVLAKDSARLNKAGYYILNNEKKFYIPEKVDADCDKDKNNEKCPRRCVDDDGQDGICYERVCPPYTPCTNRKGRVLMVNKVSRCDSILS